ncbi:MAG: ATP-binding protein, partial [Bacilli bacterium]|nr:ATP-binding protein [Bacilli bacterium]
MASSNIRIESFRLIDFKNVINGEVEVTDEKGLNNASVLGVYGQNGSGKTAIVDAIKILKSVLCGWSLNKLFAEYINVDANRSRFEYAFLLNDNINSRIIHIDYSFEISKIEKDKELAEFHENNERNEYVVQVFNESVKFSVSSNDFNIILKKQDLVLTNSEDAFGPRTKYDLLTNKNKEVELNLIVAKKYAQATSRSFIFCKEFINIFQENCQDELYKFILSSLSDFGKRNLFVIETA